MSLACDSCLRRTWLLGELAGHLDPPRARIGELLALGDEELIAAVAGRRRDRLMQRLTEFDPVAMRQAAGAGATLICRCQGVFPARLREAVNSPAVLHIAGGRDRFMAAVASDPVAIVGSRTASAYGSGVARALARGLAGAGVAVISGMAPGIDAAAHEGALAGAGATVAVLPGPAHEPYPRRARGLYRQLLKSGSAISEIPAGVGVRSWMFLARNRLIAGLAAMTIVVEAGEGSGALLTARCAADLGRPVGAVPGRVTAPQAVGPNRLIKAGAHVVAEAQDVLDLLFEAGSRTALLDDRPALSAELRTLLHRIENGLDTPGALVGPGFGLEDTMAGLATLELSGYVQRGPGGRFTVIP